MNLLPNSTKSRTIDQGLFGLLKNFKLEKLELLIKSFFGFLLLQIQ